MPAAFEPTSENGAGSALKMIVFAGVHRVDTLRFMRCRFCLSVILTLTLLLQVGCSHLPSFLKPRKGEKKQPVQVAKAPQLIGTVVLVNEDGAFVLIDNGSNPSPAMGTVVHNRLPDGTSAELQITEIRRRPFVIANILGGTPQKGTQVFQ
jgi:hypothetical protein